MPFSLRALLLLTIVCCLNLSLNPTVGLAAEAEGSLTRAEGSLTETQDILEGKAIYQSKCAVCHGIGALGIDSLGSPALSGQQQAYLLRQLIHFNDGIRGASESSTYAQQMGAAQVSLYLKLSDLKNLSVYLATLPKPAVSVSDDKNEGGQSEGYKYYQASSL